MALWRISRFCDPVKTYGRYRLVVVVGYRADMDTVFNRGYPGYSLFRVVA